MGRKFFLFFISCTAFIMLAGALTSTASRAATVGGRATGSAARNPFCKNLGVKYQASAGAQAFCFGARRGGTAARRFVAPTVSTNVDAANLAEDVSPNGTRAYGQSETSIAAAGPYVVEAWNDSTNFFSPCPSPSAKEEGTGFGFSSNGGKSFIDLGGLPTSDCNVDMWFGDPSVTAYTVGGKSYFYISSLFDSPNGLGASHVALDACAVTGRGARAMLSCGQPTIVASSSVCDVAPPFGLVCNFLDKDFLAIDPAHGRLYASFTEFNVNTGASQVELSACDLGNASGGAGPGGGTPAAPACTDNGAQNPPYFVVQKPDPNGCEYEGSYPAVELASGDVYVAYEYNWGTNLVSAGPCANLPVSDVMTRTRAACLTLTAKADCRKPTARVAVPVVSLDNANIPGYNRFPASDFPRIAVSRPGGTVSMVWNDTRFHPLGDILLQSFKLISLSLVQSSPVILNPTADASNFLPALRVSNAKGFLDVSWYSRTNANSAITGVTAVIGVSPRATGTPKSSIRVTTANSDWANVSSSIVPNFGDYTDNVLVAAGTAPYVGSTLYVAWSDGRLGLPQPFEAHLAG